MRGIEVFPGEAKQALWAYAGNLHKYLEGFYLSWSLKPTRKRRKVWFNEANRHQNVTALI